jgi:hypothetical protein
MNHSVCCTLITMFKYNDRDPKAGRQTADSRQAGKQAGKPDNSTLFRYAKDKSHGESGKIQTFAQQCNLDATLSIPCQASPEHRLPLADQDNTPFADRDNTKGIDSKDEKKRAKL